MSTPLPVYTVSFEYSDNFLFFQSRAVFVSLGSVWIKYINVFTVYKMNIKKCLDKNLFGRDIFYGNIKTLIPYISLMSKSTHEIYMDDLVKTRLKSSISTITLCISGLLRKLLNVSVMHIQYSVMCNRINDFSS